MPGAANPCDNPRETESTTHVAESIGFAALDVALLIKECTKYASLLARTAQSQLKDLACRVSQCKEQCDDILDKFDRRIHLGSHSDLKGIVVNQAMELETKETKSILKWLDAPDPSYNYTAALEKHCEGICK